MKLHAVHARTSVEAPAREEQLVRHPPSGAAPAAIRTEQR